VHFVVQFAAGQFDGEQDAHGVDLVAVVAAAHVAGDAEQDGVADDQAGLFVEIADQRVLGRLSEVDTAAGQPP